MFPTLLFSVLLFLTAVPTARGQEPVSAGGPEVSGGRAFALSLVLPGLGHRYAQNGSWAGSATTFAVADVSLWLGLIGTLCRKDDLEQSYRTLASLRAGANIEGKNRGFFLNLATYPSSDAFLETQLRNRAWDEIDYIRDASFTWDWQTNDDFQRFRTLRNDAESLGRRATLFGALLVGNRLISGLLAQKKARQVRETDVTFALVPVRGNAGVLFSVRY